MKSRIATLLLGFAAIAVSATSLARPVSYAGGWTLIETSNRASSAALLHYTPAYNYSVGARYEWMRGADIRMQAIQPTYLAKRWFGKNYQANLYLRRRRPCRTNARPDLNNRDGKFRRGHS